MNTNVNISSHYPDDIYNTKHIWYSPGEFKY